MTRDAFRWGSVITHVTETVVSEQLGNYIPAVTHGLLGEGRGLEKLTALGGSCLHCGQIFVGMTPLI